MKLNKFWLRSMNKPNRLTNQGLRYQPMHLSMLELVRLLRYFLKDLYQPIYRFIFLFPAVPIPAIVANKYNTSVKILLKKEMERKDRDLETAQCACCYDRYEDNRPP